MRLALAMCLVVLALPADAACKGKSDEFCAYLSRQTERDLSEFEAWTRSRDEQESIRKLTDEVRRLREEQERLPIYGRRY